MGKYRPDLQRLIFEAVDSDVIRRFGLTAAGAEWLKEAPREVKINGRMQPNVPPLGIVAPLYRSLETVKLVMAAPLKGADPAIWVAGAYEGCMYPQRVAASAIKHFQTEVTYSRANFQAETDGSLTFLPNEARSRDAFTTAGFLTLANALTATYHDNGEPIFFPLPSINASFKGRRKGIVNTGAFSLADIEFGGEEYIYN